jgi:CRP/FNR family transcriptional regulator, cyclic AMP receptor protein
LADRNKKKGSFKLREVFPPSAHSAKISDYQAGETIIAQGDKCNEIHYIEKGLIKLHVVSERGRSAVLGIAGAGEFFGESCMSGNLNHLTSAVALVPTTIAAIKRKTMERLIAEEDTVSAMFIHHLLARNQRIEQDLIDHFMNSSEKRLARILLLLAHLGKSGDDNTSVLSKIGQDTLAEMVGTTRSRINFFMNRFRKLGYIHYNGGLVVHDKLASALQY